MGEILLHRFFRRMANTTTNKWEVNMAKKIIKSLLDSEGCTMIFIDHQPQMAFGVASIDRQLLLNNVLGLAKAARIFEVPKRAAMMVGMEAAVRPT